MTATVSLCVISGNNATDLLEMLESFADVIDELCLVSAVGNQPVDHTGPGNAESLCLARGILYRYGIYANAPEHDWPHVDDFGAARQMAWDMATGDYQIWADTDDRLGDGAALTIRTYANEGRFDGLFFGYRLGDGRIETRERMFRRGIARWIKPIHESLTYDPAKAVTMRDDTVLWLHQDGPHRDRSPNRERNQRILLSQIDRAPEWLFYLAEEYFQWGRVEDFALFAKSALALGSGPSHLPDYMAYRLLMHLAQYGPTAMDSIDYASKAYALMPTRREAPAFLAAHIMGVGGDPSYALHHARMMATTPPLDPHKPCPFVDTRLYSWLGVAIYAQACRYSGNGDLARQNEDSLFDQSGGVITLCHATRGRPAKASDTRHRWVSSADNPGGIEHIFAIDEDDAESLSGLGMYRHVVVTQPEMSVKAWNAAAAQARGQILVQLSDDFEPFPGWDTAIIQRIGDFTKPAVLHVSDGFRNDDLMCIAILTKARYQQQGNVMFAPCYKSVFSDNEFTARAYADKVVIDAKDLVFRHMHPVHTGEQPDRIYLRSSNPANYAEAEALFNSRNPQ